MRKAIMIFVSAIVLIFLSCSKSPENAASVEVVDGIELVHNTVVPLHPEKSLTLEEELAIGGDEEGGEPVLLQAGYFIVDENGNFYITDRRDFNIKVFDQEGNHLRTIGKKGEGPGEFQYAGFIAFLPDGRLLAMDYQARRTSLFDSSGEFISSHQWTKQISRLVLTTNASYFVQELVREEGADPLEERKLVIDEIDFDGTELNSFGEFKLPEFRTISEGNVMFGISVPHSPQSVFTGDLGHQRIYHCLNSAYLIEAYDSAGHLVRKIDRPYEPLPFTGEDKNEFLKRYEESQNDRMKKLVAGMDFPTIKNVISSMLTDDQGNLWVRTHEEREEGETSFTAYDIFEKNGFYESRVWLDVSPEIILNGKLYARQEDEDSGYVYIKRYRMIWGE